MKSQFLLLSLCCGVILVVGCTPDRSFKPGTDYPEWGFDKPAYYEPSGEPVPFVKGTNGEPDIYYTAQRMVFIKRPDYPDLREAPRPSVFTTDDNGQTWEKMGYFGLGEPYFGLLLPDKDGNYGVCVIGLHRPDLAPANLEIQRVYVLDSQKPIVEITVNPEEGPYWPGQNIELTWTITDSHLGPQPVKLRSRIVDPGRPSVWREQKAQLDKSGTIGVTVEQLPATAKGVQFRVEAIDQMGNVGVGYTPLLELMATPPPAGSGRTQEIFVQPQPKQEESELRTRQPARAASPRTASENMPPWSWNGRTLNNNTSFAGSETLDAAPISEVAAEAKPATASATGGSASASDPEMAELEQLLAGVSSPVYRGRVQKGPQSEPAVQQAAPVVAEVPAVEVQPQPQIQKPAASVQQPIIAKAAPVEAVQAPPAQVKVKPITVAQAEEKTPAPTPEPVAPVVRGPIVLAPPEVNEPIITVIPPAKPEPKTIVATPQPRIVAPAEPTAEPGMIVTAKPPAQTTVEVTPSEAESPASAELPQVQTVAVPHGKDRMAKPWERLGNPDAAARNFYTYAPTLSNY